MIGLVNDVPSQYHLSCLWDVKPQHNNHIVNESLGFNRGIKHDFPFINICKVPREVLKTEGEARGFQPSRGTLQMLMNDKIMFDRYYCINSTKHCENEENLAH